MYKAQENKREKINKLFDSGYILIHKKWIKGHIYPKYC